jgi:hypothetical protein
MCDQEKYLVMDPLMIKSGLNLGDDKGAGRWVGEIKELLRAKPVAGIIGETP